MNSYENYTEPKIINKIITILNNYKNWCEEWVHIKKRNILGIIFCWLSITIGSFLLGAMIGKW